MNKLLNRACSGFLWVFGRRGLLNWISDETITKWEYYLHIGEHLNLDKPTKFNEKVQWIKLNIKDIDYTPMVDKFEAKKYVASIIGEKYIIPTIGIWNSFDEIDFDKLPEQFVLKCTHDCNGVVICENKSLLDMKSTRKKITTHFKYNFYWVYREPAYKNIKPRIIAEKFMGHELYDYKITCFHGEPRIIQVDFGRYSNHKRNLYTPDWELIDGQKSIENDPTFVIQKPECFEEMLDVARKLSSRFILVRVDLYIIDNHIYFGELTFSPAAGIQPFKPESLEYEMGSYIHLPIE